jgi:glycosyltransferase involved in cell wall biosynthesis
MVRACGRLVAKKGFLVLIEAAAVLKAEGVDVSIEIVGDGPQRRELEAAIKRHGVETHLRLLGARDDARRLIAEADIFVLPSFIEGLPLVILEAFHAGRPVVTTDLPGLRGVATHGEDALVVRAGDAEALALGIRKLIENPDAARALARVARAKAKQEFSIERTAASYLALYNQLAEARPA